MNAATSRFPEIDALRGLIMMLMAVDHASAFIARQHGVEFWSGAISSYAAPNSGAFPFLTRWITHLCAPGFFFLMGAGAYWFFSARTAAGLAPAQATRQLVVRGFLLLLLAQVFEGPIIFLQGQLAPAPVPLSTITAPPPVDGSSLWWGFLVLSALGVVLMLCAFLLRLPLWTWLLTVALCIAATNTLLPAGAPFPLWFGILLAPGLSQHVFVLYPVVPWLTGAAAGLVFARWWSQHPVHAARRVWLPALVLLGTAILLRAAGSWGNLRPPRDSGWIEFLNNVKYPPSLVFWLMTLGVNLLLLALIQRLPDAWKSPRSPWVVYGQTPLFFYLAHFVLLTVVAFVFFPTAGTLHTAWLVWVIALAALYPLCLWYRSFKRGTAPQSLWRFL